MAKSCIKGCKTRKVKAYIIADDMERSRDYCKKHITELRYQVLKAGMERKQMAKKKEVCVWVARDMDGELGIFFNKPLRKKEENCWWDSVHFWQNGDFTDELRELGLKKGECRKYMLVEIKEKGEKG